jgi:hypothetical protein
MFVTPCLYAFYRGATQPIYTGSRFRELLIPIGRTEVVGAVQGVIGRRRGCRRDVQTSREPGEVPGPVRERADAGRGDRKIHGAAPDRFVAVACVEDNVAVDPGRIQNAECLRVVDQGSGWNLREV